MRTPTIYRSVDSVLDVLNSHKVDNKQAVGALLQIYDKVLKAFNEDASINAKTEKHPLIVLEGLDGCGKSTVTKELASKINAVKWGTPPDSIKNIRSLFDNDPQLRTAYYALGNYIAALECSIIMKKQPIVMDRYWHSTSAYAIAQAVFDFPKEVEMPPIGDSFYEWPNDLLKPDAVLFLNVDEDVRLKRLSRRTDLTIQENLLKNSKQFRDNITLAYKNMINPEVIFIDANGSVKKNVDVILNQIRHLLK